MYHPQMALRLQYLVQYLVYPVMCVPNMANIIFILMKCSLIQKRGVLLHPLRDNPMTQFFKGTAIPEAARWIVYDINGKTFGIHPRFPPEAAYFPCPDDKKQYDIICRIQNPPEPTYTLHPTVARNFGFVDNSIEIPDVDTDTTPPKPDIRNVVGPSPRHHGRYPTATPHHTPTSGMYGLIPARARSTFDRTSRAGRYSMQQRITAGSHSRSGSRSRSRSPSPLYSDDSRDPTPTDTRNCIDLDRIYGTANHYNRIYSNTKCKIKIKGDPSENLFDKLFEIEIYMDTNNVLPDEMNNYMKSEGLAGEIKTDWLDAMRDPNADDRPDTWERLVWWMMDRFDGKQFAEQIQTKFFKFRQGTEKLLKFYKKYQVMQRNYYHICDILQRYHEPHEVQRFTIPRDSLQVGYFINKCNTADVQYINDYMADHPQIWSIRDLKPGGNNGGANGGNKSRKTRSNGGKYGEKGKRNDKRKPGSNGGGKKRGGGGNNKQQAANKDACYNCGKTGHFARDCWSKSGGGGKKRSNGGGGGFRTNNRRKGGGGPRGASNLQHITCYTCGEKGHYKNQCPNKGNQTRTNNRNMDTQPIPTKSPVHVNYMFAPTTDQLTHANPMVRQIMPSQPFPSRQMCTIHNQNEIANMDHQVNTMNRANTRNSYYTNTYKQQQKQASKQCNDCNKSVNFNLSNASSHYIYATQVAATAATHQIDLDAPAIRTQYCKDQGFEIWKLRRAISIDTGNGTVQCHYATVLDILNKNAEGTEYWLRTIFYLLDEIPVDIVIDRRTMRLMGLDIAHIPTTQAYHHAPIPMTTLVGGDDDLFFDQLIDPNTIGLAPSLIDPSLKPQTHRHWIAMNRIAEIESICNTIRIVLQWIKMHRIAGTNIT
eukprot:764977_1